MPIYAYKCTACGHAEDVLRKISDKPLTVCPQCNQETYAKQVTAAGFQLKGSGWYVTDFRNNSSSGALLSARLVLLLFSNQKNQKLIISAAEKPT